MRKLQRVTNKIVGTFLFLFIVTFSVTILPKFVNKSLQGSVANGAESKPVLIPVVVDKDPNVQLTSTTGTVLGNSNIFWVNIDTGCAGGTSQGNHCTLPSGALKLNKIHFSKQHHGLQIYDDVPVMGTVNKSGNGARCPSPYNAPPFTCSVEWDAKKKRWKWKATATFKYCKQTEKYESLAELNLSPLSYPTVLMGQDISSRRYSGEEAEGETVFYVKIDKAMLQKITPEKYKEFCSRINKSSSGRYYQDTLYDMTIYNSVGTSKNMGLPISDALITLCLYTPASQMDSVIAQVFKPESYKTIAVRIGIENNQQCCGDIKEPFRSTGQKSLKYLVHGFVPVTGNVYINNWAYQPKDALYAQVQGQTGATKLLSSVFLPPGKTIDDTAKEPDEPAGDNAYSTTIMSAAQTTYQMETEPETVRNAILGGVYIMDKSVISNGKNLALLSWDPNKINVGKYLCDGFPKRCPIVRAISGCVSDSAAQTDIRLRQITVALNDTERYAGVTESDNVARNSTRGDSLVTQMQLSPSTLVDRATADQLIVASGKGTAACTTFAQNKINTLPAEQKYTDEQMKMLKEGIESGRYFDMAVLASPVKVKYKGWALYDINVPVYQQCRKYGGCGNEKPMTGGATGLYNIKYTSGEKTRAALLSFNISVYMRGLPNYTPGSIWLKNWKLDLKKNLADSKIYELEDARVDCDSSGYWICSGSSRELFGPCSN